MGPVTLQGLVESAELIIYGRVGGLTTERQTIKADLSSEMHGRGLYTINASISPIEVIKGHAPDPVIVTSIAGMEDHPVFRADENAIFFLVCNKDEGTYRTVALAQGKYDVANGQVVREGLKVEEFINLIRDMLPPTSPAQTSGLPL